MQWIPDQVRDDMELKLLKGTSNAIKLSNKNIQILVFNTHIFHDKYLSINPYL